MTDKTINVALICPRLKSHVDGGEDESRQQQPDAVGNVSHDDEQRRRQHLDAPSEAAIEQLVNGHQFAAKVGRDKEQRDNHAPQHVSKDELQELKVTATREGDAGNGDECNGGGFCGDDGSGNRPPGNRPVAQEIVARRLLFTGEPRADEDDADQVAKNYGEVERSHIRFGC